MIMKFGYWSMVLMCLALIIWGWIQLNSFGLFDLTWLAVFWLGGVAADVLGVLTFLQK